MIFFQNPDRQWFKKTISQWLRDARAMDKYEYILNEYIDSGVVNVVLPVTGTSLKRLFNISLRFLRFFVWVKINRLNNKMFNVVYSYDSLEENDIVFVFFHDNFAKTPCCCDPNKYKNNILSAKCKFFVHLNHYVYNVKEGSDLCSKVKNIEFVAESDLYKHSSFFKKYFSWYSRPVKVLPFCVQDRFKILSKIKRKPKAIATGAITFKIEDKDFINFFGINILQPQRKYLLENGSKIKNMDLAIAEWTNFKNLGLAKSLILKLINFLSSSNKIHKGTKNFYSLDLPEYYNHYQFVICPSELIGLPGIGAFEAMACGAILIDDNSKFYSDYGLENDISYASYNGKIDDLELAINNLLNNPEKMKILRENSLGIIRDKMRTKNCISTFNHFVSSHK